MGANCLFTVGFGQLLLVVTYLSTIDTKILQENKNLGTGNTGKAIYIPGDIIIGGLFPVHQKGFSGEYTGKGVCGDINIDRGVQRSEAMIFTIKEINKDNSILPGVDLGVKVLDTCARGTYALEQSLEFIRASFTTLDASDFRCEDGSFARLNTTHETVAGVIGGAYSEVSKQVANLLRLFKLPQISYASTSAALSDKNRYEYFARTVPPDNFQAKAMVDIVLKFNWTYVSTVASEGNYGQSGIEEFKVKAGEKNICIAEEIKILSNSNPSTFDTAIEKLIKKENANIVVLFLRVEDAKNLLAAATRQNLRDRFVWIAADGWGAQEIPVENNEEAAKGALTIDLQSTTLTKFDDYFMSLTPDKNSINPWFTEYWESVHGCKFVDSYLGDSDNSNITLCTGREKNSRKNFKQESKVQFVYDAVQAMARAIDRMQRDICPDRVGLCPEMKNHFSGELLKEYILNTTFNDGYGGMVRFDEKGDALGRYTIMNYQRDPTTGKYEYMVVGNWTTSLVLDVDKIVWTDGTKEIPVSRCSQPCEYDEYKYIGPNMDQCCWMCIKCEAWQYLKDEYTCEDCAYAQWPNTDKRGCHNLPEQYMQWNSVYALVPMALSCAGLFATCIVIVTFIKHDDTPIVMASGRELSYMLLTGCVLCYLITFVLIAKPTIVICATQRFGVGFGFSVIYSSLLTKTNRISRIFDSARKSAKRPPFISPKSQIVIASILILIQVLFNIIWLVLEIPGTRLEYPSGKRNEVIRKCGTDDISFLVSLVYNMFLIIICTLYAVKTRKIPENFNESKFIGFSMYTTCIIWLAFIPIYFGTLNSFQIQITTLCVSISLSATVALVCLFVPKMYIIVFQPEKNVRRLTMISASYRRTLTKTSSGLATGNNHDSHNNERIRLNVKYDEKGDVTTTTTVPVANDRDGVHSL